MVAKGSKMEITKTTIDKNTAVKFILKLYENITLINQRNIKVHFSNSIKEYGNTNLYREKEILVTLHCPKSFVIEKTQKIRRGRISLEEFIPIVVTALHELRHIVQGDIMRNGKANKNVQTLNSLKNDRLSNPTVLLHMSVLQFAQYENAYFADKIYPYNPNEIDAEQYGLQETRRLLSKIYQQEVVDDALLKYIYNRIHYFDMHPSEKRPDCVYYGIPYQNNIERILSTFNVKFRDSITSLPNFQYPQNYKNLVSPEYRDFFYSAMYEMPDRIKDYHFDEFTNTFDKCKLMVFLNYKQNGLFHYIDEKTPIYHEPWLHDWTKILPQKDAQHMNASQTIPQPEHNTSALGKQQIEQVKEDPMCIESMENPCQKAQIIAVQKEPLVIQCIENPCEAAQLIAVQQHPELINKINNPTEKVKKLANDLQLKEYFFDILASKSTQKQEITNNSRSNREDAAI